MLGSGIHIYFLYSVSDCSPSFVRRSGTGGGADGLKSYGKGMYFVLVVRKYWRGYTGFEASNCANDFTMGVLQACFYS